MTDDRDPILDACLDEVLGGLKPPDLTELILRAERQRQVATPQLASGACSGQVGELPCFPVQTVIGNSKQASGQRLDRTAWRTWAVVFSTLALGLIVLAISVNGFRGAGVANSPAEKEKSGSGKSVTQQPPIQGSTASTDTAVALHPDSRAEDTVASSPSVAGTADVSHVASDSVTRSDVSKATRSSASVEPPKAAPGQPLEALTDRQIAARLNDFLRANWTRLGQRPAPPVSDTEWCQRVFQVTVGREPSAEEVASFLRSGGSGPSRELLLDQLLESPQYSEELANRWSEFWTGVFLDTENNGGRVPREGLLQYFRRGLLAKDSLRDLMSGLLTASGSSLASEESFNGATSLLLARDDNSRVRATTDVARLFLGRNIECQQCHDDPRFGGGSQEQFWSFNAFLRQYSVVRDAPTKSSRISDTDLPAAKKKGDPSAVYYTTANGEIKAAYPVYFNGTAIATSGVVTEVHRRRELAQLVTGDSSFSRNLVNRVWAAVLGRGWVASDQVVRDSVMEYPEPLVFLADQFASHGYDMRKLIRWSVSSEPFQLQASAETELTLANDDQTPAFDRYYGPALAKPYRRADEVLLAALKEYGEAPSATAATTAKIDTSATVLDAKKKLARSKAAKNKSLIDPSQTKSTLLPVGSIPVDSTVTMILNAKLTDKQKAEHLFQLTRHRYPRGREVTAIEQFLEKSQPDSTSALRAIWWALRSN